MEKCIVVSDGDKLKEIREKYNLKQEEIVGKEITRNLISEIETNKATITKRTAEIIIRNLTALSKKRHFEFTETVDYLMENEIVQANKVLDNYIDELKTLSISKDDSFIKTLKDSERFLIDWDIREKKLKIYEIAGDYFCNNNEMYKSSIYYEKALALFNKMNLDTELIQLSRKVSTVYGYIGDYKKSIECCEFVLNCFGDIPQKDEVIFRYHNALNYKHINKFELSLENIKIAENLVNKSDSLMYIKILNTKGNCLYEMKNYEKAIKIFNEIFGLIDKNETDKYLINLINIINSYWYAGMKDKSLENFDVAIKKLANLNDGDLCVADIYFEIGKIYKTINKMDLAEDYYLKALDFCEKQRNCILENSIICDLIELYSNFNNIEKMNYIKNKVLSISKLYSKINNLIMYKLITFYSKNNNDIVKQIADFAIDFA